MAEYIEREAAIKAISTAMEKVDRKIMRDRLMSIPAADVRPVVLCKDCKYWKSYNTHHLCSYVNGAWYIRKAEDFCSRGVKRGEADG